MLTLYMCSHQIHAHAHTFFSLILFGYSCFSLNLSFILCFWFVIIFSLLPNLCIGIFKQLLVFFRGMHTYAHTFNQCTRQQPRILGCLNRWKLKRQQKNNNMPQNVFRDYLNEVTEFCCITNEQTNKKANKNRTNSENSTGRKKNCARFLSHSLMFS